MTARPHAPARATLALGATALTLVAATLPAHAAGEVTLYTTREPATAAPWRRTDRAGRSGDSRCRLAARWFSRAVAASWNRRKNLVKKCPTSGLRVLLPVTPKHRRRYEARSTT